LSEELPLCLELTAHVVLRRPEGNQTTIEFDDFGEISKMVVEDVSGMLSIFDIKSTSEQLDVGLFLPSDFRENFTFPPFERRRHTETLGYSRAVSTDMVPSAVQSPSWNHRDLQTNYATVFIYFTECFESVDPRFYSISVNNPDGLEIYAGRAERISKGLYKFKFGIEDVKSELADATLGKICDGISFAGTFCPVIAGKHAGLLCSLPDYLCYCLT